MKHDNSFDFDSPVASCTDCKYCSWMFKAQLEMVLETAAGFPTSTLFSSEMALPVSESKLSLLFYKLLFLGNHP